MNERDYATRHYEGAWIPNCHRQDELHELDIADAVLWAEANGVNLGPGVRAWKDVSTETRHITVDVRGDSYLEAITNLRAKLEPTEQYADYLEARIADATKKRAKLEPEEEVDLMRGKCLGDVDLDRLDEEADECRAAVTEGTKDLETMPEPPEREPKPAPDKRVDDDLRSLSPKEQAKVPTLTKAEVDDALRRGAEDRAREEGRATKTPDKRVPAELWQRMWDVLSYSAEPGTAAICDQMQACSDITDEPAVVLQCEECGPVEKCDEDGCCISCGYDLFHDDDGNPTKQSVETYLRLGWKPELLIPAATLDPNTLPEALAAYKAAQAPEVEATLSDRGAIDVIAMNPCPGELCSCPEARADITEWCAGCVARRAIRDRLPDMSEHGE